MSDRVIRFAQGLCLLIIPNVFEDLFLLIAICRKLSEQKTKLAYFDCVREYIYIVEGNSSDAVRERNYSADSNKIYGFGIVE